VKQDYLDTDRKKIQKLLDGGIPIFEPGLDDVVQRTVAAGRLSFPTETEAAIAASEVVFIAVGTPPAGDGSADLKYVEAAARGKGQALDGYRVIVDKNTVPIGTARTVKLWIADELARRGVQHDFDVVSNPEFLREGTVVQDFMHPDRVVRVSQGGARCVLRPAGGYNIEVL